MSSNNESIGKTLSVVVALCLVCAIIVSFASVQLRPLQQANKTQDIQHNNFIDYLLAPLSEYKVKATQITLELTERDLAEDEALIADRLSHLKSLGFEVSVDDYGIGQSSLAKLKNLPVDELKIDKTFILRLDQCQKDQDIVSSTISMGHKLGLRVVAEGVENKESLELLRQFQCDYAQGYYLSRPVSADK